MPFGIGWVILSLGFWASLSVEIIGGFITAVLVTVLLAYAFPKLRNHFARFEIRYLDSKIRASGEDTPSATSAHLAYPEAWIMMHLEPRFPIGDIVDIGFAFYDTPKGLGKFSFDRNGQRRYTKDIAVTEVYQRDRHFKWNQVYVNVLDEISIWHNPHMPLHRRSRQLLFLKIESTIQRWDGLLNISIRYLENGNRDRRDIHTRAFLSPVPSIIPLPFRFIGKKYALSHPQRPPEVKRSMPYIPNSRP